MTPAPGTIPLLCSGSRPTLSAHSAPRPSGRPAAGLPSLSPSLAPAFTPSPVLLLPPALPAVKPATSPWPCPAGSCLAGPWPIPFPALISGHRPCLSRCSPAAMCPLGVTGSAMVPTTSSLARGHFDHMVTAVWFSDCGLHVSPATNKPPLGRKERLRNCSTLKIPKDTLQPETRRDPAGYWVGRKIPWTG